MENREAADPYRRLCELAAGELTPDERVARAVAIGRESLGVASAVLSYTAGGGYEIVASDGDDSLADCTLDDTWCRHVVDDCEPLAIADAAASHPDDIAREATGTDCYLGAPVVVDGERFGTLAFADREPRAEPFGDAGRELVARLADWIGAELGRKQYAADLQAQNERLEEFAGIVAHDLRNPLSVAMGHTTLAADTATGDQLQHLAHVDRSLKRMKSMIADCLMLAKEGTDVGEREPVELAVVVADAWESVDTGAATLTVESDTTVVADATRLQQLLENLFRNAVEHGGEGVAVTVADRPDGFVVANDGPPLPDGVKAALQDADTENIRSFGLGLLVVTRVVSGHGWTLGVDSGDDGVRFEITDINTAAPVHRE